MNIEFTSEEQKAISDKEKVLTDIGAVRDNLYADIAEMKRQIAQLERGIETGEEGLVEVKADYNKRYEELEQYIIERTKAKMKERFA